MFFWFCFYKVPTNVPTNNGRLAVVLYQIILISLI